VPASKKLDLATLGKLQGRVSSRRIEQAIVSLPAMHVRGYQRLLDEICNGVDDLGVGGLVVDDDGHGIVHREVAGQDRELPQDELFEGRKKRVAPIEQRAECLVPSKRRPAPPKLEAEAIVKPTGQISDAQALDTARCDLNRKRDAVQSAAEIGDDRGFCIAQLKAVQTRRNALHEQLYRRVRQSLSTGQPSARRRSIER